MKWELKINSCFSGSLTITLPKRFWSTVPGGGPRGGLGGQLTHS